MEGGKQKGDTKKEKFISGKHPSTTKRGQAAGLHGEELIQLTVQEEAFLLVGGENRIETDILTHGNSIRQATK